LHRYREEACKEAYRHLNGIHGGFAELATSVEESGRCGKAARELERRLAELAAQPADLERVVRRCRLTASNPVLKARVISLLKTTIS
jgi:hypothetical protein